MTILFTNPHPGFHHCPQEQSLSPIITPSFQSPNGHQSGCIHRLPLRELPSWVELHGLFQPGRWLSLLSVSEDLRHLCWKLFYPVCKAHP